MRAVRLLAVLSILLALAAAPAAAHELGVIQVNATFRPDATYHLAITVDEEHIPPSLPAPAEPGRPVAETRHGVIAGLAGADVTPRLAGFLQALVDHSTVAFDDRPADPRELRFAPAGPPSDDPFAPVPRPTLHLVGDIPGGARTFTWSTTLPLGTYALVAQSEGDAVPARQWLIGPGESRPAPLAARSVPPTRAQVAGQYLVLGFTHILPKGLDHILFVLGLFLLSQRLRPVLLQVTAFTLAHTLTLALTVYGVVSLPASVVEPLIALSIVYVAVENLWTRELRPWRLALVFAFGLLHGMGFAGVLSELGLPRAEFLTAIVSFNVGVEAGQLTVLALAFLALALPFRTRPWYRQAVVIPASLLIAAVGLYWSIERVFF